GKTSLLQFLADQLDDGKRIPLFRSAERPEELRWVVVNFNAWQHQRIVPPWWWLLSTVSRQGRQALWRIDPLRAVGFHLRRARWRAAAGLWWYVAAAACAAVALGLWLSHGRPVHGMHLPSDLPGWLSAA